MITPPALPPVTVKKSRKMEQPATIITSLNNPSNQSNGNLLHHINKTPVYHTPSRSNQAQLNSQSCTALSGEEEINHLNKSFDQMQKQVYTGPTPNCEFVNSQIPNNYMPSGLPQYSTLPTQGHKLSMGQNPQQINQHVHTHAQTNQLNNDLNLSFSLIENDIKEIRDYLRHTRKKLENTDAKAKQTHEWKQVALVLDRTLFFIYIIAIIVSFILMFPR